MDFKVDITGLDLQSSQTQTRTSCPRTVFYKENVPVNPDQAGQANIYPEGRKSHLLSHSENSTDSCWLINVYVKDNATIVLLRGSSKWLQVKRCSYGTDRSDNADNQGEALPLRIYADLGSCLSLTHSSSVRLYRMTKHKSYPF